MQNPVPIDSLLYRLAYLGPHTDPETIESLLARKEEALPYVIRLAEDEKYWYLDEGYSIWAPICAIHLLSAIGGREPLNVVYRVIYEHCDEVEDWMMEEMASVMAAFGPDSFDLLENMILDIELDEFYRAEAARSLLMISQSNNEVKMRAISLLKEVISAGVKEPARSLFVDALIEFKDKESLPFIESLFKKGLVDTSVVTSDEVLEVYAGKYDSLRYAVPVDPLDIFKPDTHNFYRKSNESAWLTGKVGRNEPCPCGSGKKHKKCCLKIP